MIDLLKLDTKDLQTLVLYQKIRDKGINFPKHFWTEEKNQKRGIKLKCCLLTRFCLENLGKLEVSSLPSLDLKEIRAVLVKHRLFGMLQTVFRHDILAIIKNAYPEDFFNSHLRDWMWSRHGIWDDPEKISQAVKDMVRKEGIKNIKDIPAFDWKKRLLSHGIYNVLHCFNWSIFKMFDFVYPNTFHPADFRYRAKWKESGSLENAFYTMDKVFREKNYSVDRIMILNVSDFRRIGLAAMLITVFGSSVKNALEYYFYKTVNDPENSKTLQKSIEAQKKRRFDDSLIRRLKKVSINGSIYSLRDKYTLYNFLKRHARKRNMSLKDFMASYGFVYENAQPEPFCADRELLWELRKKGCTYVQIADKLSTNPTKISELCREHFGGDPLIPRPLDSYITPKELMEKFRVDHKTVMKLVEENNYENHMTIRFRYLKKSEIIPALEEYVNGSKSHKHLVKRYS